MTTEHLTLHRRDDDRPRDGVRAQSFGRDALDAALQAFLLDRQARACTDKTLTHYQYTVGGFLRYLHELAIATPQEIQPTHIRSFFVHLQERGLKDSTIHAHARGIKAWCNWLVQEGDLHESPMERIAMPRVAQRIPEPFTQDEIRRLLDGCDRQDLLGCRNYAVILTLLDTGLRAAEFCSLGIGDVDMRDGLITVVGKGRKQRQTVAGAKARAAIVRMLGWRPDATLHDALWKSYDVNRCSRGSGLTVSGLQSVLRLLGQRTGLMPCGPHKFRRTFALWCLRDGMDVHTLRMLMGHSSLAILERYLKLMGQDLTRAHRQHSPADRLLETSREA